MLAGVSQVCITPPVGLDLTGFISRENPSTGVHDDLYARGLFLSEGRKKLLWLHLDLLGLDRSHVLRLREAIGRPLSLLPRQIVISCTHTHAGAATIFLRGCGEINAPYMELLDRRIMEAASMALEKPQPVTLRFAETRCAIGIDRRTPSRHSHIDPRLPVLVFARPDGHPAAVLASYGAHNVVLPEDEKHVSAGFFGLAAEAIRQELPGRPVMLLTAGACGNVNPSGMKDRAGMLQRHSEELKRVILGAVHSAAPAEPPTLDSRMAGVELPLDIPTIDEVHTQCRSILEKTSHESPRGLRVREAMRSWRDDTVALLKSGPPTTLTCDVQTVRIGHIGFALFGAEVFSRMGDDIRQALGPNHYVVGYAGGDFGYLLSREAYAEGGYEVDMAHRYYGSFRVSPGAFETLRDEAIRLLRQTGEK